MNTVLPKRRFLIITRYFQPDTGGTESYSFGLARGLTEIGQEVTVVAPRVTGCDDFDRRQDFRIIRYRQTDIRLLRMWRMYRAATGVIREGRIDVLLATGWSPSGIVAKSLAEKFGIPYLPAALGTEISMHRPFRTTMVKVFNRSHRVIVISRFTRDVLLGYGVRKEKIAVVFPGIDERRFRPRAGTAPEVGQRRGEKILLTVSRLTRKKGVDRVIGALPEIRKKVGGVKYLIVGEGEDRGRLQSLVERLGLQDTVRFLGRVPEVQLVDYYNLCDLFILTSREEWGGKDFEGFGIVFSEASACAKPVIGGRSGGISDAVVDGRTGILVEPDKEEEIARAVISLLEDPGRAEEMGRAGRRRVEEELTWPAVARRIVFLCGPEAEVPPVPRRRGRDYLLEGPLKRRLVILADGLGRFFVRCGRKGPIDRAALNKILLIRLDHIGDVLMTTPALRALRRTYPHAEIHILVKELTAPVLSGNPHHDGLIVFNSPWTIAEGKKAPYSEIFPLVFRLRREGYDCVIDFRADLREALMSLIIGAPCRVGYGARGGGFCFTREAEYDSYRHDIRKNLGLIGILGARGDGEKMDIFLSDEDEKEASRILAEAGFGPGLKTAGIHPGAASPYKQWGEEGFARICDLLAQDGYRVILLGAGAERALLEEIKGKSGSAPALIAGLNLKVLSALIRRLDLLVCHDTAPSHIAQAVGTKSVVLFGPTDENITGPLDRKRHRVVCGQVACRPCWRPGMKFHCPYDLRCWKELSAEMVVSAIREVENGSRPDSCRGETANAP